MSENIGILSTPSESDGYVTIDEQGNLKINKIITHKGYICKGLTDTGVVAICAGSEIDTGGRIFFYGNDRTDFPGEVHIVADNKLNNDNLLRIRTNEILFRGLPIISVESSSTVSDNGTIISWYRKYKDGWIEQGGYIYGTSSYGTTSVTFPIAFKNLPVYIHGYFSLASSWFTNANIPISAPGISDIASIPVEGSVSTTGCKFQSYASRRWYACGY